jgi:hypothetical protein
LKLLTLLLALALLPGCLAALPVGLATMCCVTVTPPPPAPNGEAQSWIPEVSVHAPAWPSWEQLSGQRARPQAEQQQPYPSRVEEVPSQHEETTE